MKKEYSFFGMLFLLIIVISANVSSSYNSNCNLNISLVNQDPYPAIPGDLLKVVLQVNGIESSVCGDIELSVSESFPFTLDPSSQKTVTIKSGTYLKDYKDYLQVPFKLRVNEEALDGENSLEVQYRSSSQQSGSYSAKQFQIEVKDVRADFEVFVKDYDSSSITFQVLNIGKEDINAVTVEIPEQDGVAVKGTDRTIVGDLDSNEDTTADFQLTTNVTTIKTVIYYTDSTGERRNISKDVSFNPHNFINNSNASSPSIWSYFIYTIILLVIVYFIYKKFFSKRKAKLCD